MVLSSNQPSFEAAVLPHLDAAFNLARWLMRDPDTAQDVVQEAVMRALTYFPNFRGINPRAWLLQIVRNAAYASMKLNRGLRLVPIEELANAENEGTVVAELHDPAGDPDGNPDGDPGGDPDADPGGDPDADPGGDPQTTDL